MFGTFLATRYYRYRTLCIHASVNGLSAVSLTSTVAAHLRVPQSTPTSTFSFIVHSLTLSLQLHLFCSTCLAYSLPLYHACSHHLAPFLFLTLPTPSLFLSSRFIFLASFLLLFFSCFILLNPSVPLSILLYLSRSFLSCFSLSFLRCAFFSFSVFRLLSSLLPSLRLQTFPRSHNASLTCRVFCRLLRQCGQTLPHALKHNLRRPRTSQVRGR